MPTKKPYAERNPERVAIGRRAMRSRYGPDSAPTIVRIGDLSPDQRRLVKALIEAQRTVNDADADRRKKAAATDAAAATAKEERRHAVDLAVRE